MEIIIILLIGLALGSLLSYFYFKQKNGGHSASDYQASEIKLIQLQSQLDSSKELFSSQINDKSIQLEQCKQEVIA
ncbi:MAG: hypothetical protein ACKOXV_04130 [Bacteroidota bacterium]